jgi:hypothetical protein
MFNSFSSCHEQHAALSAQTISFDFMSTTDAFTRLAAHAARLFSIVFAKLPALSTFSPPILSPHSPPFREAPPILKALAVPV